MIKGSGSLFRHILPSLLKLICIWNINTSRIGLKVIACDAISASALTAADVTVFADSTATFDLVWGTQIGKQLGMAINIDDIVSADVACGERQKTRRLDIADM